MADHIVHYYKSLFFSSNFVLQDQELVDEVIPQLIDDTTNNLLTMIPSEAEVRNAVFNLNHDSAYNWEIVSKDVYDAVLQFFQIG